MTNTTQSNLELLGLQSQKEKDLVLVCGKENQIQHNLLSISKEDTKEFLSKRYCNGIIGVPCTFLCRYNCKQFRLIGHDHDISGEGGAGVHEGQFETARKGKYKRILVQRIL